MMLKNKFEAIVEREHLQTRGTITHNNIYDMFKVIYNFVDDANFDIVLKCSPSAYRQLCSLEDDNGCRTVTFKKGEVHINYRNIICDIVIDDSLPEVGEEGDVVLNFKNNMAIYVIKLKKGGE